MTVRRTDGMTNDSSTCACNTIQYRRRNTGQERRHILRLSVDLVTPIRTHLRVGDFPVRTIIGVTSVLGAVRFPVHLEFLWGRGRTGLESKMQWINYCVNKLATKIAITCRDRYFWLIQRTLCNSRNGRSNSPRTVARVTTSLVT